MTIDQDDNIFNHIELDAVPSNNKPATTEPKQGKPTAKGKEGAQAIAEGTASFKDVEGPMSVSESLAFRPAADALPRNVTVSLNESTEDPAERAILKVLGLANKGKRIKGKGEKNLDLKGLLGEGDRILDSAVYRKWEKQPTLTEIADKVGKIVVAENREMIPALCKNLYLGKDGSLYLQGHAPVEQGNKPHRLSGNAYTQIAQRAPDSVKGPLRYNINSWAATSDKAVRVRRLHDGKDRPLAFAAVGPKYNEFDCDKAVKALADKLPLSARARWSYHGDGGLWKVEASLARSKEIKGDLHELGLWLKSSDDGQAGIAFGFAATRWTCSNTLRILHSETAKTMRHVGDVQRFIQRFEEILQMADDAWKLFETVWGTAKDAHPIDRETGKALSVEEAIIRLCAAKADDKFRLSASGASPEQLAGRIMTCWEVEPDDSIQGLVNAVTRASHEWQWKPSSWADDDLEEQAGKLLYAHVLDLPSYQVDAMAQPNA